MAGTVGEIRASVAELGAQAWTVAKHLADDDALPEHPLGAEVADYPLADDTVRLATPPCPTWASGSRGTAGP
jgi:hypothetical protein